MGPSRPRRPRYGTAPFRSGEDVKQLFVDIVRFGEERPRASGERGRRSIRSS